MPKIKDLLEERAGLVKKAQCIQDKVDAEKRRFTAEETGELTAIYKDVESLTSNIELLNKSANINTLLEVEGKRITVPEPPRNLSPQDTNPAESLSIDYGSAKVDHPRNTREYLRSTKEYLAGFTEWVRTGYRNPEFQALAHQADSAIDGGYLLAPQQMVSGLLKFIDDSIVIRQLASRFTVSNADSLGVVTLDKDVDDADWTSELATGNETDVKFGKRQLTPHPLAKRVKISNKLLAKALMSPEALVRQRLGYKFSISQEKAFLTGDGAQKPLGLFVANTNGIPTTRDVATGNAATTIGFDGLINALYSLKSQYQTRATWLFHRDAIKQIRTLKDNMNQYLWQPSVQVGAPDTILGRPYVMSEYVPNTFTTGQYVGMIADFSYYWIVDSIQMQVQRLVELYAETNQIGLIARMELDGMPVLDEAFTRVKLG